MYKLTKGNYKKCFPLEGGQNRYVQFQFQNPAAVLSMIKIKPVPDKIVIIKKMCGFAGKLAYFCEQGAGMHVGVGQDVCVHAC